MSAHPQSGNRKQTGTENKLVSISNFLHKSHPISNDDSATPNICGKLYTAAFLITVKPLVMDSGNNAKSLYTFRPMRKARRDSRITFVIKDGWTSYHVQGNISITLFVC